MPQHNFATLPREKQLLKNHYNQNKYVCKTYLLKFFFANFHTKIKICVVLDTFTVFVNKCSGYCCK